MTLICKNTKKIVNSYDDSRVCKYCQSDNCYFVVDDNDNGPGQLSCILCEADNLFTSFRYGEEFRTHLEGHSVQDLAFTLSDLLEILDQRRKQKSK